MLRSPRLAIATPATIALAVVAVMAAAAWGPEAQAAPGKPGDKAAPKSGKPDGKSDKGPAKGGAKPDTKRPWPPVAKGDPPRSTDGKSGDGKSTDGKSTDGKSADGKSVEAKPAKPKVPPAPPELLLTFDDGPHLERTPKVLETLAKHNLHAVFFVNGVHFLDDRPASRKAKALLRDMVAAGHAVGNHTIHHYFLCGKVYSKRADEEIEGNARLIEGAIGRRPELYRTPFGSHCPTLTETHKRLGVKHIGWDIDPQDWKLQNTEKVRDFIINHLKTFKHGREILLMHDIHQCSVEALPQILDWIDGENAARVKRGELPIRIIDYSYLLPPRPAVPPILDGIGRILIDGVRLPDPAPILWLLTGRVASS